MLTLSIPIATQRITRPASASKHKPEALEQYSFLLDSHRNHRNGIKRAKGSGLKSYKGVSEPVVGAIDVRLNYVGDIFHRSIRRFVRRFLCGTMFSG